MSTLGLKKEFINGNIISGLEEEAHLVFSALLCSLVRKGFCPGHRECIDKHFSIDKNALFPSHPQLPLMNLNSESYLQIFLKKNALSESELATWFDSHFKYEVISDNSLKIVSSFTTGTHTFFSKNKVLHRSNGPAYLRFSNNGAIQREFYYIKGKKHREAGPARIFYYENGKIEKEAYYINGKCHRLDGPAIIHFHDTGCAKQYFYKGKEYNASSFEEFLEYVESQKFLLLKSF